MQRRQYSFLALASLLCLSLASADLVEAANRGSRRARGTLIVRPKSGASPRAIERAYARAGVRSRRGLHGLRGQVVEMAPQAIARVQRELRLSGLFKSVERDYFARANVIPNDPNFNAQWSLPRTGVPAAWDLTAGDPTISVAVLDTGVDLSHPDLAGQLESGYDFINDDADPSDDHGHGTRMAGVVAASWNNGLGIAGVAPTSRVVPVKVLGEDGTGPYSAIAEGITWAVDQGARVINLSLSGDSPSQALQDAVNYATAAGAVCVGAAGNDGADDPVYPAATNGAVAVGAIDENDNKAWFSNTGAWLSHVSPGVSLLTTDLGGGYTYSTGTSPAAAFTSGIFALLFSYEPSLSPGAAIARVEQGAFDLGSEGWDSSYGWGGIDALATLVPGEPGQTPPDDTDPEVDLLSPTKGSLMSGNFGVEVVANDNVGIARVELFVDNRKYATEVDPPYSFVVNAADFENGKHKLRAYAFDAAGNRDNTKNIKILTTDGVGLLVKKAKVVGDKVRITGQFALPEGVLFDPAVDSLSMALESGDGTVLAATADPGDIVLKGSKTSATVSPVTPNEGSVQFRTKHGKGDVYKFKIKAAKLDPMLSLDDVMNLSLQVGGSQLSQALSFQDKGSGRLVYP